MESFHLQLQEEVQCYERLKRGEFEDLDNLRGLGHLLIARRASHRASISSKYACNLSRMGRDLSCLNASLSSAENERA